MQILKTKIVLSILRAVVGSVYFYFLLFCGAIYSGLGMSRRTASIIEFIISFPVKMTFDHFSILSRFYLVEVFSFIFVTLLFFLICHKRVNNKSFRVYTLLKWETYFFIILIVSSYF